MRIEKRKTCKCGCGQYVTKHSRYDRWNAFIHGHNNKGPLHYKYNNGGLVQKVIDWRNEVYKRDNYTCQKCSNHFEKEPIGKYIHAHHIKSKKEFPELIFVLDNGQTLCNSCHKSLHNSGINNPMYGLRLTEEQKHNISVKLRGQKQSEETKRKRSISMLGHPTPFAVREKIRIATTGKIVSEETKKKQSISRRAYFARKKEGL